MLGRTADASAHGRRALSIAVRRGDGWNEVRARGALGLNDLGRGNAGASAWLQPAVQMLTTGGVRNPNMFRVLGDLIESEVRLGRVGHASDYLVQFLADAELSGNQWARAVSCRCRVLVADDAEAEAAFAAALERHEQDPSAFERARTLLCYGERLRRLRQRRRAREQLYSALDIFERLGSQPWAERTRAELRASGEHLRRKVATHETLAPQELQVAIAAAEGLTNTEIAARLFLSPKTVEFHLSRTYRKLDVRSRGELIKLFAERGPAVTHLA